MSAAVDYVLLAGLIALPAYAGVRLCNYMLQLLYENQSLILSILMLNTLQKFRC